MRQSASAAGMFRLASRRLVGFERFNFGVEMEVACSLLHAVGTSRCLTHEFHLLGGHTCA